jgi:hypothetical protein
MLFMYRHLSPATFHLIKGMVSHEPYLPRDSGLYPCL